MTPSLATLELVLETMLIQACALAVLFFFRRISAATQHGLLSAAVLAVLVVTVASPFVPSRHLGLVPLEDVASRERAVPVATAPATDVEAPAVAPAAPRAGGVPPARSVAGTLGTVWLGGSAFVLLWVVGGLTYGWWLSRQVRRPDGTHLTDRFRWALEQAGLRSDVRLVESDRLKIPVVFGWLRPVVILPAHAAGWHDDRLRAVLLHETAHIRRRDLAYQFVAKLTCALYWFNPLAWVVERKLFLASERAADDDVIRRDVSPADYAEHLMETSAELGVERTPLWATAAMAEGTAFKDRILSILDPNVRRGEPTMSDRTVVTLFALVAIFSLVMFSPWKAASSVVEAGSAMSVDAPPARISGEAALEQGTTDDLATLLRMLLMQDPSMREHAAEALGALGDERAVMPLVDVVLHDANASVREHAAVALGRLGDPRAVQPLVQVILDDASASVREHAATALGDLREGRAFEPLVETALHDANASVREHAVVALGKLGNPRAFHVLLDVMYGKDVEEVRVHGAFALGLLGDPRALEPLMAALEDDNARMRANAAQGLGELGDVRAINMLRQARTDPDQEVRQSVEEALRKIRNRK